MIPSIRNPRRERVRDWAYQIAINRGSSAQLARITADLCVCAFDSGDSAAHCMVLARQFSTFFQPTQGAMKMYRAYWAPEPEKGQFVPAEAGCIAYAAAFSNGVGYAVPSAAFLKRIRLNPNYYPAMPGRIRLHLGDQWLPWREA